jgi:solute carrier family 13 (sodium-dependent dicarboxylate transporter), member 2/3/5
VQPHHVALAIVLVAAVLWITEVVPLYVTALLVALLNIVWLTPSMRASGLDVDPEAFLAPFFSNIILLFLGGFVLSAALQRYGLDTRMARAVLLRTGSSPPRVLLGLMLVTAFLSMWMSNTATTAMMLGLAFALLRRVPLDDPYRKAVLLGIAFSANLGGLGTPIGTPPNAIVLRYASQVGIHIGFARWVALTLPILALSLALLWLLLLRRHPATVRAVHLEDDDGAASEPWSPRARLVAAVTVATAAGWLTSDWHPLATGTVALLPVLVLFGLRVLDVKDLRALPWDVLLLVGGGLSLGMAVGESGLGDWIVASLPVATAAPWVVLVGATLLAAVMTSIMSNTATANLLVPIVVALDGVATSPVLLAVAYACSMSMALPVSTPPNAMVFASGTLRAREMVGTGLLMSVIGLALTLSLGIVWWRWLGVM